MNFIKDDGPTWMLAVQNIVSFRWELCRKLNSCIQEMIITEDDLEGLSLKLNIRVS